MRFGSVRQTPTPPGPPTRRRRHRTLFALLFIPLLSGMLAAPVANGGGDELSDARARQKQLEQQIKEQKAEVAQLNRVQGQLSVEISRTRVQLGAINADLSAVRASIATMVKQIADVRAKYEALVAELGKLDAQLVELVAEENAKREELRDRKALLADRLRAAYDTDRVTLLETFLSGGSFTDVLIEVGYQLDVGAQDRALAERVAQDQETLAALQVTVGATRDQTNLLRQETAVQKKALDRKLVALKEAQRELRILEAATAKALAEQKRAYARLAANKSELQAAIRRASRAQSQLSVRIRALIRAQQQRGNIPSQYNGTLSWPLVGNVTQDFGCTGFSWEQPAPGCPTGFHRGIDIARADGAPVRAAGAGVVVFVGYNPYDLPGPQAWIVIIAHSGGLQTWYAHMQPVQPSGIVQGASVRKGDVIGYQGSTGRSTGSHLHWAVMSNNEWVNPRLYL